MVSRRRVGTTLLAHVEICRPDTVFYAGTVGLAGALLAVPDPDPAGLVAAWLVPTLGWVASLYGGDWFDRELDATAKPDRPIPSGRMSARTAFGGMVGCIGAGAVVAVVTNPRTVLLVLAATVLGILYSRVLKARGLSGNVVRGAPTALAFVFGTMMVTAWPPWYAVVPALVFWVHDSASNIVGALCDTDTDRAGGYLTFPVVHGERRAVQVLAGFTVAWVAGAALAAPALGIAPSWPFAVLLALAVALSAVALVILLRAGDRVGRLTALRAHEYFVVDRLFLAAAFVALSGASTLAAAVLLPSLPATVSFRRFMRQRDDPAMERGGLLTRSDLRPSRSRP